LDANTHSDKVEYINRVSSELSAGVHKMLDRSVRTTISLLLQNTSIFMNFISVGYSAIWCLVQVAWLQTL